MTYLGYNNSGSLSPYSKPWAWQAVGKNTIAIYHASAKSASDRSLRLKDVYTDPDSETGLRTVVGEAAAAWTENTEYLFAFPVDELPTTVPADHYTTFPTLTPVPETQATDASMVRKEISNGQILIRRGNQTYTILGIQP